MKLIIDGDTQFRTTFLKGQINGLDLEVQFTKDMEGRVDDIRVMYKSGTVSMNWQLSADGRTTSAGRNTPPLALDVRKQIIADLKELGLI